MSARSISFGTTCGSRSLASWLGATEGTLVWLFAMCAPAVVELEPGQCAVLVGGIGHQPQRPHVVLVPEARGDQRRLVGVGRERRVLGADRGPAALGLDAAVRRLRPGLLGPEPGAVGHLVEAVPERLRPDPDRLEQDLVVRIHPALLLASARPPDGSKRRRSAPGSGTPVRSARWQP